MPARRLFVTILSGLALAAIGCGSTVARVDRTVAADDDGSVPKGMRKAPARIVRECRSLATELKLRVWCPTIVPAASILYQHGVSGPMFYGRRRDIYEVSANNGLAHRHWMIGAGRPATVRSVVIDGVENQVRGKATPGEPAQIDGTPVAIYRFLHGVGGPHSGHILAMRCTDSECVYASVHGTTHRAGALALLKGLRPVD
jgi:hypothetical protein